MCGWGSYAREASVWEACCWYSGVICIELTQGKAVDGRGKAVKKAAEERNGSVSLRAAPVAGGLRPANPGRRLDHRAGESEPPAVFVIDRELSARSLAKQRVEAREKRHTGVSGGDAPPGAGRAPCHQPVGVLVAEVRVAPPGRHQRTGDIAGLHEVGARRIALVAPLKNTHDSTPRLEKRSRETLGAVRNWRPFVSDLRVCVCSPRAAGQRPPGPPPSCSTSARPGGRPASATWPSGRRRARRSGPRRRRRLQRGRTRVGLQLQQGFSTGIAAASHGSPAMRAAGMQAKSCSAGMWASPTPLVRSSGLRMELSQSPGARGRPLTLPTSVQPPPSVTMSQYTSTTVPPPAPPSPPGGSRIG